MRRGREYYRRLDNDSYSMATSIISMSPNEDQAAWLFSLTGRSQGRHQYRMRTFEAILLELAVHRHPGPVELLRGLADIPIGRGERRHQPLSFLKGFILNTRECRLMMLGQVLEPNHRRPDREQRRF